jgi:hypothetical protein
VCCCVVMENPKQTVYICVCVFNVGWIRAGPEVFLAQIVKYRVLISLWYCCPTSIGQSVLNPCLAGLWLLKNNSGSSSFGGVVFPAPASLVRRTFGKSAFPWRWNLINKVKWLYRSSLFFFFFPLLFFYSLPPGISPSHRFGLPVLLISPGGQEDRSSFKSLQIRAGGGDGGSTSTAANGGDPGRRPRPRTRALFPPRPRAPPPTTPGPALEEAVAAYRYPSPPLKHGSASDGLDTWRHLYLPSGLGVQGVVWVTRERSRAEPRFAGSFSPSRAATGSGAGSTPEAAGICTAWQGSGRSRSWSRLWGPAKGRCLVSSVVCKSY